MQITIDTKHDSPQEIRKAIKMLSSLVSHSDVYSNSMDEDSEPVQKTPSVFDQPSDNMGGMMGIFDSPAETETKEEEEVKSEVQEMEFF
jgi:hypothetical protein